MQGIASVWSTKRSRRLVVLALLATVLALYISSYIVLSRRGFAYAELNYEVPGFYFLPPENTDEWRFWNYTLVRLYYPLIYIDNLMGTGRPVGSEPLWDLS